jgi:hypothetical protein
VKCLKKWCCDCVHRTAVIVPPYELAMGVVIEMYQLKKIVLSFVSVRSIPILDPKAIAFGVILTMYAMMELTAWRSLVSFWNCIEP